MEAFLDLHSAFSRQHTEDNVDKSINLQTHAHLCL